MSVQDTIPAPSCPPAAASSDSKVGTMITSVQISKLLLDAGTQQRVVVDMEVADDYGERMTAGDTFPAIIVFSDGEKYWPGDGFHRIHGEIWRGSKTIRCDVRNGTVRDAILFACAANGNHVVRRTTGDKRKAVNTLLLDKEWSGYSDGKIAELCNVSQPFVSEQRRQLKTGLSSSSEAQHESGATTNGGTTTAPRGWSDSRGACAARPRASS
jgi:hypothetical protein